MRALISAAGLVFAALVIAGCGSSEGEKRREFVAQAEAVCADRSDKLSPITRAFDQKRINGAEFTERYVSVLEDELRQLDEVDAPPELAGDWKRVRDGIRLSIELDRRAASAFRMNDSARGNDLNERARRANAQSDLLAREMSLKTCGKALE